MEFSLNYVVQNEKQNAALNAEYMYIERIDDRIVEWNVKFYVEGSVECSVEWSIEWSVE